MAILAINEGRQRIFIFLAGRRAHKSALPLAMFHQPQIHQLIDGFPEGRPADPQGLGQFPLRQEFFTGAELAPEDQVPQLFKDLVGDPLRFYGFDQAFHRSLEQLKLVFNPNLGIRLLHLTLLKIRKKGNKIRVVNAGIIP